MAKLEHCDTIFELCYIIHYTEAIELLKKYERE